MTSHRELKTRNTPGLREEYRKNAFPGSVVEQGSGSRQHSGCGTAVVRIHFTHSYRNYGSQCDPPGGTSRLLHSQSPTSSVPGPSANPGYYIPGSSCLGRYCIPGHLHVHGTLLAVVNCTSMYTCITLIFFGMRNTCIPSWGLLAV